MGLSFHKTIRLSKHIHLHVSTHGVSVSIGSRRARVNLNKKGISISTRILKNLTYRSKRKKW